MFFIMFFFLSLTRSFHNDGFFYIIRGSSFKKKGRIQIDEEENQFHCVTIVYDHVKPTKMMMIIFKVHRRGIEKGQSKLHHFTLSREVPAIMISRDFLSSSSDC
jgi:hypothetical protein